MGARSFLKEGENIGRLGPKRRIDEEFEERNQINSIAPTGPRGCLTREAENP
jgi:hypothetical protein